MLLPPARRVLDIGFAPSRRGDIPAPSHLLHLDCQDQPLSRSDQADVAKDAELRCMLTEIDGK